MNRQDLTNNHIMTLRSKPDANASIFKSNGQRDEDEGESRIDPYVGLEFDTAEGAQEFYNTYATHAGFKIRIGQLYRSRVDGSVISRRYVCSKEGYQTTSRTGCPAFIRVQKNDSGKWVLANIKKEHNHDMDISGSESGDIRTPPATQRKTPADPKQIGSARTAIRSVDDDGSSGVIDLKRLKREELDSVSQPQGDPFKGLEFNSANEAYKFYHIYAVNLGFKVRIGQLFRSKNDGSITSRRFVCSKEGHQHPTRVGCGAFMRIQREDSGRWVVDRLSKEHNHELDSPETTSRRRHSSSKEELAAGLENLDLMETNGGLSLVERDRGSGIGSRWYTVLMEYFQSRQSEDTGFFYAVEVDNGRLMSVFWADGRSRFSCTQFGDAVIFDTSYRRGSYSVPFAAFSGVNHHRQPVLLGCALISDDSEDSFKWVFKAWVRAMSGRRPVSIIADQDKPIQTAIAKVFPSTHHRFSTGQILAKQRENLGGALWSIDGFKFEYDACVSQTQTATEFESAWNVFTTKYNLKDNEWLKEMYITRKSWVPFYLKSTFFAGIPVNGSIKSYFDPFLPHQVPINEFIIRYEQAIEHHREEERKEDYNSYNSQTVLHTKDPMEEQCLRLYTVTVFKVFQKELLESYSYVGIKINIEGAISRYLVQRCGNGDERNTVAFNGSNLNITCSCRMFEFEGVLCRHALKVFQIMNIREIPSRYILHRWTKSAKSGILRDVDSGGGGQDFKALMVWSLREEAHSYIDAGAASFERYKLAFEILQEGRRNLCWQN